jgi:hypothetical protein
MSDDGITARLDRLTPAQRAVLATRLAAARGGPPLRPRPGSRDRFPLGMDQERLWVLDRLEPGSTTYALSFGLRFHGALDVAALVDAARSVVRRHESLRSTVVADDGRPELRVWPDMPVSVRELDLRGLPEVERDRRHAEFLRRQVGAPFDLSAGPLLRLGIVHLADDDHQVCETMHHSTTDQWSYVRLNRELLEHYGAAIEGRRPVLPDLPVQFGDFAHWQRQRFSGEAAARHRAFWRDYLAGAPSVLSLPYDASPETGDRAGAHHRFLLDERVGAAFQAYIRTRRTTLATALLAVYAALLFEETGERDVVIGLPSVTRGAPESQNLIGFLLTNVPIRVRLPERPAPEDVLAAATAAATAVAEHREVPFSEIVAAASPNRSATRYPLLQTMHLVLDLDDTVFHVPDAEVHASAVTDGVSPMDLTIGWWRAGDLLYGRFEYRTALFTEATVDRLARRLLGLVETFVRRPGRPLRPRATPALPRPPSVLASAPAIATPAADRLDRARRAWCEVLDVPDAHPDDAFFEVGGTSVLAVRLAGRLRAAGFTSTVRDVFTHPTLGGLAALPLAGRHSGGEPGGDSGRGPGGEPAGPRRTGPAGPEQALLLRAGLPAVELWAHTVVLAAREPLEPMRLRDAVAAVVAAHPGLGMTFACEQDEWLARAGDRWAWRVTDPGAPAGEVAAAQRAEFDAGEGPLFAASLTPGDPAKVLLTASHLVIDGLSWGVVVDDLAGAYAGATLEPEPVGQLEYAAALRAVRAHSQAAYWRAHQAAVRPMTWATGEPNVLGDVMETEIAVPLPAAIRGTYQAEAATAVARAVRPWTEQVVLMMVALGREQPAALPRWDGDRAVGYHACSYPLHLPVAGGELADDLATVGAALRSVPDGGKGFGLLRAGPDPTLAATPRPYVTMNYLGALSERTGGGLFTRLCEIGPSGNAAHPRTADLDVVVALESGRAVFTWRFSPRAVPERIVGEVAHRAAADFRALLDGPTTHVPGESGLSDERMDELLAELSRARRAAR